ncbi:hypothetical protein [Agrococcus beijingensis]|uniref:hypothetical protein n=1 Tax=Agrococcus beijingensis TaxID=3068634 RepID=UPI002741B71D|nr:hypothetical protein [Agrococcus sp. REN33]
MPKASSNPTQRPRPREAAGVATPRSARDRWERALAVSVVVLLGIALLGFAATMAHVGFRDSVAFFASVVWQWAYWLPLVALPLAIVCLVALIVVSARGKSRSR